MKSLIFYSLLILIVSGCKKEEKNPEIKDVKSRTELLCGKNWKLAAFKSDPPIDWDGNGYMVSNLFPLMEECDRDNLMMYSDNGTYIIMEGDSACSIYSTDTVVYGSWSFSRDFDTITRQPIGGNCLKPVVMNIDFLSDDIFRVSYTLSEQDGLRTYFEKYFHE